MRRFFQTLPLWLLLVAKPGHAQTADGVVARIANAQISDWSARRHHYSHRVLHPYARQPASSAFAWLFANPLRQSSQRRATRRATSSAQGSCAGTRIIAAWYSSGRRTASGAPFNAAGYTAAHRSLPFGSRVTVTNPRTGRSVTVTINDRGPFTHGVTLDLARGAAQAIGMSGTQAVCMS